jgi:putative membrane protein
LQTHSLYGLFDGHSSLNWRGPTVRYIQLVLTATAAMSIAAAYGADPVSGADRDFVALVSQGGLFEVKAGELGATRGSTQDIVDQGSTEAHDHQLVGDKLKAIATANGIKLAASLNAELQEKLDHLSSLSGEAFDAAYLLDMEVIHSKDGAAFAKEARFGATPALRALASETHRIVVRHVGELRALGPKKT